MARETYNDDGSMTKTVDVETIGDMRRYLSVKHWKTSAVISLQGPGGVVATLPTQMGDVRQMLVGRKNGERFMAHIVLHMNAPTSGAQDRRTIYIDGYQATAS
tara:strand:- start:3730 stop:4038 length:309 start_codon:yes stop_codon:yes gene_type:complete